MNLNQKYTIAERKAAAQRQLAANAGNNDKLLNEAAIRADVELAAARHALESIQQYNA